ncbi:IclR family transcriptional regulator [Streptomyces sp. B6B3]|uniref:IclR family transcriptional regulator n=1 Tax=Streptomyces sp. B6B3 TaxID=3153570 RepID=UPI00325D3B67
MTDNASRSRVQSVDRAALLLAELARADQSGRSLGDLAGALGVARSTAHALLRTLKFHGLVGEIKGPRFVLGTGLVRLGDLAARQFPLADLVRPALAALVEETGMTARFAVPDDGVPVFTAKLDGGGPVRFQTPLGSREMAHSTATGKVFLADLPEEGLRKVTDRTGLPQRARATITDYESLVKELERVREQGFAVDDEEDLDGVICVAAGVRDQDGVLIGALSLTDLKLGRSRGRLDEYGLVLGRHARELADRLGPARG